MDRLPQPPARFYPGTGHLFTDSSLDHYDEAAARLLEERLLAFLEAVG